MNLIILDRDGTINEDRDDFVKTVDEWVAMPGALEAIARLNHAGWQTVIATNQSGLGRGLFDMATLNLMHAKMNVQLARVGGRVSAVFFCPHTPEDQCDCRKPLPGLYLQIGERFGADLANVPVVGDSLRDLQAGAAVGCKTHFVQTGKAARLDAAELAAVHSAVPQARIHADLAAFVHELLHEERIERGDSAEPDSVFGVL